MSHPHPQFQGPLFLPPNPIQSSSTPPISLFGSGCAHPIPPIHLQGCQIAPRSPLGTNKWYTQLALAPSGSDPIYPLPYALAFLDGHSVLSRREKLALVGLGISHASSAQRVFGPPVSHDGPARYYYNPLIISVCLGATLFNSENVVPILSDWSELACQFSISCSPSTNLSPKPTIVFPISRGSAFVTALYTALSPTISSAHAIISLESVGGGQEQDTYGFRKHRVKYNDGSTWLIYSRPLGQGPELELQKLTTADIGHTSGLWSGVIQVVKMSDYYAYHLADNSHRRNEEAVYDKGAGVWVKAATIRSGPINSGMYSFDWVTDGPRSMTEPPLMFTLPHHIEAMISLDSIVKPDIRLQSRVTGAMQLCRANTWSFQENVDQVAPYGITPFQSDNTALRTGQSKIDLLRGVLLQEMETDFDAESDLDSYYFSGKKLAKQALQCLTASCILQDDDLASLCVAKTKKSLIKFCQNRQRAAPLVYETTWKGIISSSMLRTGNKNDDFGNGIYNDHHFHYSYFIHAAAILVYLDRTILTEIEDYISDLIRDINNFNEQDDYFPLFRTFDWFLGHSLATGLDSALDGKNQESCSEDANFLYSLKVWAEVTQNMNLKALTELQLCLLKRSINNYYFMMDSNVNVPIQFKRNRVPGILFENKADYTTFFSNEKEAIHMIQVIPITPISKFIRSSEFVWEEWIGSGGVIKDDQIQQVCEIASRLDNGYKFLLFIQYGIIEPNFVWEILEKKIRLGNQLVKQADKEDHNNDGGGGGDEKLILDDGISLSWSLGFLLSCF